MECMRFQVSPLARKLVGSARDNLDDRVVGDAMFLMRESTHDVHGRGGGEGVHKKQIKSTGVAEIS